jgi:type II secretion system protein G
MFLTRACAGTVALLLPLAALAQSTPNSAPLTPNEQKAARAAQCAARMRGIAQAIFLYSNDHNDNPPPDLGTLCLNGDVDLPNFVCPGGGGAVPDNWKTMPPKEQAAWVNAHTDYLLLPGKLDLSAEAPLLVEKLDDHAANGANVAFRDGHVEFLRIADLHKLLGPTPPASKTTRVKLEPGKASLIPLPTRVELQTAEAKATIAMIKAALMAFEVDYGRYPTTAEGLAALTKKPAELKEWHQTLEKLPNDPWGHPYMYTLKAPGQFQLSSAGPDGKPDTADDISGQ